MPDPTPEPVVQASIVDLWNRFGWPDDDTLASMTPPPVDRTVSDAAAE